MKIVELIAPRGESEVFNGIASVREGRRYMLFSVHQEDVFFAFRGDPGSILPGVNTFWWQVRATAALENAAAAATRGALHWATADRAGPREGARFSQRWPTSLIEMRRYQCGYQKSTESGSIE